jgi:hypothetical protein
MNRRVTWLLPVKNGMPFLRETLASIAAQTHDDHEVLAWDDASSDSTLDELRAWLPKRIPGRVIVSDKSVGIGAALHVLVNEAATELCARIDGDDLNEPNRLADQTAFLESNPRVAVVGANMMRIDGLGTPIGGDWRVETADAEIRWRLRWCNAINHPTAMFRRSAVLATGNYRATRVEDYDLWMRLAARHAMANLQGSLVRYRVRPAGFSESSRAAIDGWRRELTAELSPVMFPGIPAEAAARLREIWANDESEVTLRDLVALRRTATSAARRAGLSDDAFRRTTLFRRQRESLLARWAKAQPGVAAVLPLVKAVMREAA